MTVVNTAGMSFIGPGSEWFWAALSGIVTMVTLLAIWRQLRIQRNEASIAQVESFARELFSERALHHRLAIHVAAREGTDPARLPEGAAVWLANYWEGMATLARRGHLDSRLIWSTAGQLCQIWWLVLAPWIGRVRADFGEDSYPDFEWMARTMREMDERAGSPRVALLTDPASLDRFIARLREQLRVEQSLRTVIIAPPEAMTAPSASAAAPSVAPAADVPATDAPAGA